MKTSDQLKQLQKKTEEIKENMKDKAPLLISTALVLISLAGILTGYFKNPRQKTSVELVKETTTGTEKKTSETEPEVKENKPITYDVLGKHAYIVEIKIVNEEKIDSLKEISLKSYIAQLITENETRQKDIKIALYDPEEYYRIEDTRENLYNDITRTFNNKYYVLTYNKAIGEDTKTFKKDPLEITFEKAPKELIRYLESPKYCRVDKDCVIRKDICTYGAFNEFQTFTEDLVCRVLIDDEGIRYTLKGKKGECSMPSYQEAACVDNRCVPLIKSCADTY